MNIKPRLDKDIPKKYLYLALRRKDFYDLKLDELKGRRDNESKNKTKELKEYKAQLENLYDNLALSNEVNLYNNKYTVRDFTKDRVDFNTQYVIRIKPVCMFETWQSGSNKTYDLYSFKTDKIIHDEESLMYHLKKDNIVDKYIINKFLNLCYSNEEYTKPREDFIEFVNTNYLEYRPSFSTIVDHFKKYSYDSCTTYKADGYKTKYYEDAYRNGFIRLYEEYGTESTIMLLLRQRMFDVLDDWFTECDESTLGVVKAFSEDGYSKYESVKEIKKLLLENLDNAVCKKIYDFIGFRNSGYVLKVIGNTGGWDDEEYLKEKFEAKTIEEVKKHIIKNYECDFNEIANSKIDGNWVSDNFDNQYELKLNFVE